MKLERSDRAPFWAFMTPALVLMIVFFVIPVIYVVVISFMKWNGINTPAFVSFKNFMLLFRDKAFKRSIIDNIIWAMVAGFIQVPLAMVMAISLSRRPKGWKFFRTVYFFPQVISGIALATLWRAIYRADTGLLNALLRSVGLGHLAKDWLGTLETAFPAVVIYWVFYVGYYMVIMMADITTFAAHLCDAGQCYGITTVRTGLYAYQWRPCELHIHNRPVHVQKTTGCQLWHGECLGSHSDYYWRHLHCLYPEDFRGTQ